MKILENEYLKGLNEGLKQKQLNGNYEIVDFSMYSCTSSTGRSGFKFEMIIAKVSDNKDEDLAHEMNGHGEQNILEQLGFDF